jgi:hypothetical protein
LIAQTGVVQDDAAVNDGHHHGVWAGGDFGSLNGRCSRGAIAQGAQVPRHLSGADLEGQNPQAQALSEPLESPRLHQFVSIKSVKHSKITLKVTI